MVLPIINPLPLPWGGGCPENYFFQIISPILFLGGGGESPKNIFFQIISPILFQGGGGVLDGTLPRYPLTPSNFFQTIFKIFEKKFKKKNSIFFWHFFAFLTTIFWVFFCIFRHNQVGGCWWYAFCSHAGGLSC